MCDKNCTNDCQHKRCETLRTLTRLEREKEPHSAQFGRFSYHSGFIAQLMSQQKDTSTDARRNRKTPQFAISAYEENQAIIAGDHLAIFAKVS